MRYAYALTLGIPLRRYPASPPSTGLATAAPSGTSYSYTAQVLDSANHVIAGAGNSFLTAKVFDDHLGPEGWPAGLKCIQYDWDPYTWDPYTWDPYDTPVYSKTVASNGTFGNTMDFTIDYRKMPTGTNPDPKTWHAQLRLRMVNAGYEAIPLDAKAIGMWINPHVTTHAANKLLALFYDADGESFWTLYGKFDPVKNAEDNFRMTQDSHLLNWEGWRFVTMPFDSAEDHRYGDWNNVANRPLTWMNPFYLERQFGLDSQVEITGVTYQN